MKVITFHKYIIGTKIVLRRHNFLFRNDSILSVRNSLQKFSFACILSFTEQQAFLQKSWHGNSLLLTTL